MQNLKWFEEYEANGKEKERTEQLIILEADSIMSALDSASAVRIGEMNYAKRYNIRLPIAYIKFMKLFENPYGERLISEFFNKIKARIINIDPEYNGTMVIFDRE